MLYIIEYEPEEKLVFAEFGEFGLESYYKLQVEKGFSWKKVINIFKDFVKPNFVTAKDDSYKDIAKYLPKSCKFEWYEGDDRNYWITEMDEYIEMELSTLPYSDEDDAVKRWKEN
jgi:hypothetical protein